MNTRSALLNRSISLFLLLFVAALFAGCYSTTSRIQKIQDPLNPNETNPGQPIVVEPVETGNMKFTGDKADDPDITERERQVIDERLDNIIQAKLSQKTFQVRDTSKTNRKGTIIDAELTAYHRGDEFFTGQLSPGGRWQTVPVMRMAVSVKSGASEKEVSNFVVMGRYVGEYGGDEKILEATMAAVAEQVVEYLAERLKK